MHHEICMELHCAHLNAETCSLNESIVKRICNFNVSTLRFQHHHPPHHRGAGDITSQRRMTLPNSSQGRQRVSQGVVFDMDLRSAALSRVMSSLSDYRYHSSCRSVLSVIGPSLMKPKSAFLLCANGCFRNLCGKRQATF